MQVSLGFNKHNPFEQFLTWYDEACRAGEKDPHAAVLATSSHDLRPSARVVFVERDNQRQIFDIFTNINSRKGKEIESNPEVSLCFYWSKLGKQVRISGKAELVDSNKADLYFASRARGKQINAWVSNQSEILNEEDLIQKISYYNSKFADCAIPRPPYWSGFSIIPTYYEFWINNQDRFHQRDCFELQGNNWHHFKLQP